MIWSRSWVLHVEARRGRWPIVRLRPTPRPGDRMLDGGEMGTVVRCPECGGNGVLHRPDKPPVAATPPDAPEATGQPWQGVAVTVAACLVLPDDRSQGWQPYPTVLGPDRLHQVMKTALALGKCRPTPIPGDVFAVLDTLDDGDTYAVLDMVDAEGDVIGNYVIPDEDAFRWWVQAVDLRVTETGGHPS